jgi:netrin-G3 ligand
MVKFSVPQGAPQNFSAVGLTETSVRLAWDLPANKLRNGEIVSYQLIYYQLADSINVEEQNISGTQYDVTGLEMNTDYVFQIKAYTVKVHGFSIEHLESVGFLNGLGMCLT